MTSHEPDYVANTGSLDVTQEVFGGMTTIAFGFTRGQRHRSRSTTSPSSTTTRTTGSTASALTQILTPRWLMSANFEALSDDGYLGSPYRVARVFGAAVPERNPRTRSGRAVKLRLVGDLGNARRDARRATATSRDTWDIKAHTAEIGYSRYFGENWLADSFFRYYTQTRRALLQRQRDHRDDLRLAQPPAEHLQQHGPRRQGSPTTCAACRAATTSSSTARYEYTRFKFKDFTDVRDRQPLRLRART